MRFLPFSPSRNLILVEMLSLFYNVFDELGSVKSREEAVPHVIVKEAADMADKDPELAVLEKRYGKLGKGKRISVKLCEMLALLPRKRKRSDAYHSLKRKLAKIGVELEIKPNKYYKDNNYEEKDF